MAGNFIAHEGSAKTVSADKIFQGKGLRMLTSAKLAEGGLA